MISLNVKLNGTAPLLMHCPRFANPLDPLTQEHKALTSKRTKTQSDHEMIAQSEFIASCYYRPGVGMYLPSENLEAALVAAAKLQKLGVKFKQAVRIVENELPLAGVKDNPAQLWKREEFRDVRGVRVGTARLMRYRPIFREWEVAATISVDDEIVNANEVVSALHAAGARIGVGDYRPRFGCFSVSVQ